MPRTPKGQGPALALVCALLCAPMHAAAQQETSFRLSGDGDWTANAAPELGSDEATIAEARRRLAEDRPSQCLAVVDRWLKDDANAKSPLQPEALLLRGDAHLALENEFEALYSYEAIQQKHPASDAFEQAAAREHSIAMQYLNGLRKKWLGMRFENATDIGIELLIRIQERMPGSAIAERAGIDLADYYYDQRKMSLAYTAYDLYLMIYPKGTEALKAKRRRIFAGIARFKGPLYDATPLLDAREQIHGFANQRPAEAARLGLNDSMLGRIDESLAAQRLAAAQWRLKRNEPAPAKMILTRVLREHPRSAAAAKAEQLMQQYGWQTPAPTDAPNLEQEKADAPQATTPATSAADTPASQEAKP